MSRFLQLTHTPVLILGKGPSSEQKRKTPLHGTISQGMGSIRIQPPYPHQFSTLPASATGCVVCRRVESRLFGHFSTASPRRGIAGPSDWNFNQRVTVQLATEATEGRRRRYRFQIRFFVAIFLQDDDFKCLWNHCAAICRVERIFNIDVEFVPRGLSNWNMFYISRWTSGRLEWAFFSRRSEFPVWKRSHITLHHSESLYIFSLITNIPF